MAQCGEERDQKNGKYRKTGVLNFKKSLSDTHVIYIQAYAVSPKLILFMFILLYTLAMTTQIKALIFDLDGLILDTETPDYKTWQDVYVDFGYELPLEKWVQIVGGTGASDFDPHTYLEELTGQTLKPSLSPHC